MLRRIVDFRDKDRREAQSFASHALDHPRDRAFEVHVGEWDDAVVGYLCLGPNPLTDGVFDLYWIAVDPDHEGRGLGGALLAYAEERAVRRAGRMMLIETSSAPGYRRQRNFYRHRGYERVARIPDFFAVDEHKVIYRKVLAPEKPRRRAR